MYSHNLGPTSANCGVSSSANSTSIAHSASHPQDQADLFPAISGTTQRINRDDYAINKFQMKRDKKLLSKYIEYQQCSIFH